MSTEDFYFNVTKEEITEMETDTSNGLAKKINHAIVTQDMLTFVKIFKRLILKAYGENSTEDSDG